jgi:hypothetical protein
MKMMIYLPSNVLLYDDGRSDLCHERRNSILKNL